MAVVEDLVEFIQEGINENRYNVKKDFHIVIRQDDDNENISGQEIMMITSSKPLGVDKYIAKQKDLYQRWEEGQNNRLRY
jgi:ferredoxin-like protein FixX